MDEAKSMFHMSISAMFAAMLIGAIAAIIGVSYLMWSYFSKQDAASAKMTQYSNLTAFDNTTLRGSEVESLLTYADSMGIYVLFYDSSTNNASLNEQTNLSLRYYLANPKDSAYNTISSAPIRSNTIATCKAATDRTIAIIGTGGDNYPASTLGSYTNLHALSHTQLVSYLTTSTLLGDPNNNGNYGVFKSTLIYSGDATTDVVGIALVRANAHVTNYCAE